MEQLKTVGVLKQMSFEFYMAKCYYETWQFI